MCVRCPHHHVLLGPEGLCSPCSALWLFLWGAFPEERERERHKESLCKGIFISVAILPLEASSSTFSHMTIIYFKLYGCTAREESHGCDPMTAIKGDVLSEILVIYPDM